jgi:hypothetical protein
MTLGLQNMRRQTDTAFPTRDRTSDGGVGDKPHRLRRSGHNPDDTAGSKPTWNGDPDTLPEWRAWDMDADLRTPGVTTQQYVDHVRHLPGLASVVRFIIFNGKIYQAVNGFVAETYYGDDQHREHVHVEGTYSQAADNNTTFNFRFEELINVPMTDADWAKMRTIVREEAVRAVDARVGDVSPRWNANGDAVAKTDGNPTVTPAESLFYVGATARRAENNTLKLLTKVDELAAKLPAKA